MLRSLTYHWRMSLAVAAGAAVTAAVLTGALLVGDSVRGSLEALTVERLGTIDLALTARRFFPAAVVDRLRDAADAARSAPPVPAILLRGAARHGTRRSRAGGVGIAGVDGRFFTLFPGAGDPFADADASPRVFPPVVLNAELAAELGAAVGDDVLLSLPRRSAIPSGSLLGHKDTAAVVDTVRATVAAVLPDRGVGRFSLAAHQATPKNAFLRLADLQQALGEAGRVNAVLVDTPPDGAAEDDAGEALDALLRQVLVPEDLGLRLTDRGAFLALESTDLFLPPPVVAAAERLVAAEGGRALPIYTYLANRLRHGQRSVPYSTVSALALPADPVFGALQQADGSPAPAPPEDGILLDRWAADELAAAPGDTVELTYFAVGAREELREETAALRVTAVVELAGLAADRRLTQEVPGITGVESMADWDPPFPFDLERIRPADEAYWHRWGATPKAFLALATGRRLWGTRWGDATAVWVAPPPGGALQDLRARLAAGLVAAFPADGAGLTFLPVRRQGLAAAAGATDFAELFVGFSLFLIVAAALIAGLLFRLAVEQRGRSIGLLAALGYPAARIRQRLLGEGALLAGLGAAVGLAGAVGYAAAVMAALGSWWRPAVGTGRLALYVTPTSLFGGYLLSLAVVLFVVYRTARRVSRLPATRLLAGQVEPPETRPGRLARWTAGVGLTVTAGLLAYAFATGATASPALFFTSGPALLAALLALFELVTAGRRRAPLRPGRGALLAMAAANAARNRGRSLLATTLVASASFVLVTVAAFRHDFGNAELGRASGTGGYTLVAESEVPLYHDLGSPAGRFALGIPEDVEALLDGVRVVPFRLLPGEDVSCLNLYRPRRPRLLGVPEEQIRRGGFTFQAALDGGDNPWELLARQDAPDVLPALGDGNSTQWILKLPLGGELPLTGDRGEPLRLRLVGNLAQSLFQSELLVSEADFVRAFPDHGGHSYFLIDAPAERAQALGAGLERALEAYGFDAVPARDKLAAYLEVENTYLSTFQTLGSLGLLLGTLGVAILLLRNVLERRGELAALRAIGFRRSTLTRMVVVENGLLLAAGVAVGTLAAVVTVAPQLASPVAAVPWRALLATLASIFAFGLAACAVSAALALGIPLLPALAEER